MKSTRRNKTYLRKKSREILALIVTYVLILFGVAHLALESEYIKIILETIASPLLIGLIFGFVNSLKTDYDEYYENLAHDYKKEEESN